MINELAQWAVLVVLAVFVVGLTRQLGAFITPRRTQLSDMGPDIGSRVPDELLALDRDAELGRLVSSSPSGAAAIVVVDPQCAGCKAFIADLARTASRPPLPFIAVIREQRVAEFHREAVDAFELVLEDPAGSATTAAGIFGTPFVMLVDEEYVVRHKDFAGDLLKLVGDWIGERVPRYHTPPDASPLPVHIHS